MPRPKRARRAPPAEQAQKAQKAQKAQPSATRAATTNDNGDGGHGDGGRDDQPRGRPRGRPRVTRSAAARDSLDEHDAALHRRVHEDLTMTSGRGDDAPSRSSVVAATPPPASRRDTSGLDLADDSVFGDLGDSFADGHVPEGPHSGASSTATLSHPRASTGMRRRSRQSSMIGRHDPPIRPGSRGGGSHTPGVSSSFNIGVFLRRAREPSILGASRRAQSRTGSAAGSVASSRAGSVVPDSEFEEFEELEGEGGELAPEAESTPSKSRRRSRRSGSQNQNQEQNQRHRHRQLEEEPKRPSLSPSPPPSPSPEPRRRSTRKRKSDHDDVVQSQGVVGRRAKVTRVEANGGLVIGSDSDL
ncbi:hypothetical protein E4U42_000960, partial [Claviceps africana]